MPVLAGVVDRLVSRGHGLLLLAGTSVLEVRAALAAVLACLQDRLPRRALIGDWVEHESLRTLPAATDGEDVPVDLLLQRALGDDPAVLALPWLDGIDRARAALRQARERVVIAPLDAADAARAAGRILQVGHGETGGRIEATDIGILGARVMERLCEPCRRPCDPAEILAAAGAGDAVAHGPFFMSEGCSACRGSGILALEPVFEFLDLPAGRGAPADAGGGAWGGRAAPQDATLFHAALRKAAAGVIDAREPIRFLLHEQS
ncbi:MAG TPA: hypothetical protein VFX28_08835 [Methylomirabilota bacterium]|nr:hypothetical protein [Methylomirabilota bacterium]